MIFPAAHEISGRTPRRLNSRTAARAQELAREIDADHLVPLGQRQLLEWGILLKPGVVHQDVDGPEFFEQPLEHRLDLLFVRDVSLNGDAAVARLANRLGDLTRGLVTGDVIDGYIRAVCGERERDLLADPGARTGHERRLSTQPMLRLAPRHDHLR